MEKWLTSRVGTAALGILTLPLLLVFVALECLQLAVIEGKPWSINITRGDQIGERPPGATLTLWSIKKGDSDGR